MNEKISTLAKQANEMARALEPDLREVVRYNRIRDEKFAELIVRECVTVMYDNAIERRVPPDINQTPTHYAIAVLEHFGVEE